MTIECRVVKDGKTIKITHLTPGSVEVLSSPFLDGEETTLHVDTDDDITLVIRMCVY